MLKKSIFFIVGLFFLMSFNSFAKDNKTPEYYCDDKETIMEYEALIQKYPNDPNAHALHALWLGLCIKTNRGDLTIPEANAIFDDIRSKIIGEMKEEKKKKEESESL
ncbi:hypothetical protein [Flexistipes sp.]|uniref:hypothetical protein n=1 Tax=Flexistipes sp. TaxID=3088135 RepID=UPI002E1D7C9B|nr:hypothetical protein [Flexistipes sp.]